MSESDRTVFLNEKEEGYGGDFTSQDFVNNQYFESHAEFQNSDESVTKKIRLSEEFNHQEGDGDSSAESSPLGLTLRKTPSFLRLLETKLSKEKQEIDRISYNERSRTKIHDLGYEKLKASNFPAFLIKIGAWQRISKHEGDLVAKLYYAKRKIVWEVLGGALKSKIEIHWSNIIAIRGIIADENEPGILEIELNEPPLFYRETNPQPRKHTLWQQASDFTGGQAPSWRRHYVKFPPGILDKHYEKLLQCDKQLFDLSQKPFPSQQSPYFLHSQNFLTSEFSLNFNGPGPGSGSGFPFQQFPYLTTPRPNSSLLSVVDFPFRNDNARLNYQQQQAFWHQRLNYPVSIDHHQGTSRSSNEHSNWMTTQDNNMVCSNSENYGVPNVGVLNDIENHLLDDSQVVCSDERTLLEKVDSMCSLLVPEANHSEMNYNQVMMNNAASANSNNQSFHGSYSDSINWIPTQLSNGNVVMEAPTVNNSAPPFMSPCNPTYGDFFNFGS